MSNPILILNTDNMPRFCRSRCANINCTKHISKAYECGGPCRMSLMKGQQECEGHIPTRRRNKK